LPDLICYCLEMDSTTKRIRRTITLLRHRGYLAPDHATASASKLLEAEPTPPGFAFVAAALLRHAAILDPFDRDKLRLAEEVNASMRHAPFDQWAATARKMTDTEPIPEGMLMPGTPEGLVDYIKRQPANILRLAALLRIRRAGDNHAFEAGVQHISGSSSGLLAAPIMAWHAHFLGKSLLAEMLLDEGVPNFLTHNLRALMALEAHKSESAARYLTNSLEMEPFQPGIIEVLSAIHEAIPKAVVTRLQDQHARVANKMSLEDMREINRDLRDDPVDDFLRILGQGIPSFKANATVFWQTLALSLR